MNNVPVGNLRLIGYPSQVDETRRLTGLATHLPVVAARVTWNEVVGSRLEPDEPFARRSA